MKKIITYNGKEYTVDISWTGSCYALCVIGLSGYKSIPNDALHDINVIESLIVSAIEDKHELDTIEKWNGVIERRKTRAF